MKSIFHSGAGAPQHGWVEAAEKEQFLRENMVFFNSGELTQLTFVKDVLNIFSLI